MGIASKNDSRRGKKHQKKPVTKASRSRENTTPDEPKVKYERKPCYRKLDVKKRAFETRERQRHMENARLECVRLGIGAVKYLSPKNDIPQLEGCPLQWKHKSRLASNLKRGKTPRMGEHLQHLTDAEEHDVSIEMVRAAHDRNPRTWRSMEEVVAETIATRANGPDGREFTQASRQGAIAARKGRAGFKWRHGFAGRNGLKDFAAEDLGQSRARACNEHVMNEHLTDLRAELIDCGVMDPGD